MDATKLIIMALSAFIGYGFVQGYRYIFEANLPIKGDDFNLDAITKSREQLPPKARKIIRKAYSTNRISRRERSYLTRHHSRLTQRRQ